MGMIGFYIAVATDELEQILDGEISMDIIDSPNHNTLDIDKSWQALNFLMCNGFPEKQSLGNVVPMKQPIMKWIESGCEYGAFYLTSSEVQEAFESMNQLDEKHLFQRYDFETLKKEEVYPIVPDDEKEFFGYLYNYFEAIHKFYEKAVEQKSCIVFFIS